MEMIGKRFPWYVKYKIGFDNDGLLLGVILDIYVDCGNSPNDNSLSVVPLFVDNAYSCKNWLIRCNLAKTNLAANTACRSPGTFPSIVIMENMIEHVIKYLKADPVEVRRRNFYKKGDISIGGQPLTYFNLNDICAQLIVSSEYAKRKDAIVEFNRLNRWKKRGI